MRSFAFAWSIVLQRGFRFDAIAARSGVRALPETAHVSASRRDGDGTVSGGKRGLAFLLVLLAILLALI